MSAAKSMKIFVTELDKKRIEKLLDKMIEIQVSKDAAVKKLENELDRAVVVESGQIPPDVITMNSKAVLQLDGEDLEVSLVYPDEVDLNEMNISIFSPIGTAILGYREGSAVEWEVPSGISKIQIKKILYQPEAAGDFDL